MGREEQERRRSAVALVGSEEPTRDPVSVAVAESPQLMLDVLVMALSHAGLRIAGACTDVDALVEIVERRRPQVALLDSAISQGGDALGAIAQLRAASPTTSVVVLARELTPSLSRAALAQEVDGLVTGMLSSDQLADALRQVAAGQAIFPAGWISAANRASERALDGLLSPRQLQVLELLAAGLTNGEIAARLHLSANTVKFHVRTIYERAGVSNRVQAAAVLARDQGPPAPPAPPGPPERVATSHSNGRFPTI